MDESLAKTQEPPEKHGPALLICVFAFLVIYFLFPVIFEYPVIRFYGSRARIPPRVETALWIFFYPARTLVTVIPAYRELITWEVVQLGIR